MAQKLLTVLKFGVFLLLIPPVITTIISFIHGFRALPNDCAQAFFYGVITYVAVHLFWAEPQGLFAFSQSLTGGLFRFFAPLSAALPLVVPIYAFFFLAAFYLVKMFWPGNETALVLVFFAGFSFGLHLILTAKGLRKEDANAANYYFGMTLVFIVSLSLTALILALIFPEFSLSRFFTEMIQEAARIYTRIFRQLFVAG